jgi:hypothetical protein
MPEEVPKTPAQLAQEEFVRNIQENHPDAHVHIPFDCRGCTRAWQVARQSLETGETNNCTGQTEYMVGETAVKLCNFPPIPPRTQEIN